jgi:hypothetical protein
VRWPPAWELIGWNNESVVGYSPAGKDVGDDTVRIRYQDTTIEDTEVTVTPDNIVFLL